MKARTGMKLRPVALASAALVAAVLGLTAAQRAHAQSQQLQNTLIPTQNPCTSCDNPAVRATPPTAPGGSPSVSSPQSLPAAPVPQTSFRLNDLRLNGAQALTAEQLKAVTQPYIGRDVTLADLEALAQSITDLYRARGFFLAQAVIPVQTVQDGVVEVSVIEGKLGNVTVNVAPDAPIKEERVRNFLAVIKPGMALDTAAYERAMLLLSDQPGIRVTSQLQEGITPGTTDLNVDVIAGRRWEFSADADNYGTEESGRYRIGGTARWLSPFGIGDNLDARIMASNGSGMLFGRMSYEAPIGSSGFRAGVGAAHVYYELGGSFANLDAHGTADVLDFSLSYPMIRSRHQNLFLRLSGDMQDLTDHFDAVGLDSKKRVQGVGLGWAWEYRDDFFGGGYWASSGSLYHGHLDINSPAVEEVDQAPFGPHTQGSFDKLTMRFSRLQAIIPRHSLYVSVGAQLSNKNLDASQKLSLGGPQAVRAYPSGELLVDTGVLATVEWRWSYNEEITPFLLFDAGRGNIQHDPLTINTDNTQSLRGVGFGVSWARPNNFSINATLAWRAGTREAITDGGGHNPRLFVQLQKAF
ncbi:ShlB/FhaC/HecB family hemolysin secretion/activation protein [Variovorax sp. J22R133]|uniref:ShlB/FhaC/HecB family hemolysin secretion/activation protein n=1 Tax=Variovorax brevis TaxID=3053503 RepID=UPI002575A891|nr:ShlB/FhaC/HecB family hemolysin secretion/activation protein [Variovorax sp. J22R133]MDM0117010.1 ShlB/FhaC/HecB family hemolysin secretion/activation protein [Variovorax sp. J22R133]